MKVATSVCMHGGIAACKVPWLLPGVLVPHTLPANTLMVPNPRVRYRGTSQSDPYRKRNTYITPVQGFMNLDNKLIHNLNWYSTSLQPYMHVF